MSFPGNFSLKYKTPVNIDSNLIVSGGIVNSINGFETDGVNIDNIYESISNKVTSITSGSTDIEYPTAKSVYDGLQLKADANILTNFTYIHYQDVASDIWTITHNLGRTASVTVIDSANSIVYGEINFMDTNRVVITFSGAFSGKAYFV